jgi:dTDP-4-dehydrorhamnose 3,5-epimerase
MQLIDTKIDGCYILQSKKIDDNRGFFIKIAELELMNKLHIKIEEIYYTRSKMNVIRGMHFQASPYELKKIVTCTFGEILDVFLDIRSNSLTFGQFDIVNLSDQNGRSMFVPEGVAHGFKVLSEEADVLYLQSKPFAKDYDSVIKYDSFGFNWNITNPILSQKDINAKTFDEFITI